MKTFVLSLLMVCGLMAQPTPPPSPITALRFAQLPAASGSIRTYVVTDCLTSSCTAGGGLLKITMVSNGSAWSPAGSGGGSGGCTSSGAAGTVQVAGTAGACNPATGFTYDAATKVAAIAGILDTIQTDTTSLDISTFNNGYAPITIRGNYAGAVPPTHVISAINAELLMTPTDSSDYLSAGNFGTIMLGSHDFNYLNGNNINIYDQNTGGGGNVVGMAVDAEIQVAGTLGYLADFQSYGIITAAGSVVTDAYHYDAVQAGPIAGTLTNLYSYSARSPSVSGTVTNAFQFWAGDIAGAATNAYYYWSDSQGVRRVKEDITFNAVGQAIEAAYNPQFTKYTPGAANYERGILGEWESNVFVITTEAGGTGTLRNIAIDGAEVELGTASHLVNIPAASFKFNGLTCTVVAGAIACT